MTRPSMTDDLSGARQAYSGVTEPLTARHTDLMMDEGEHEHTWLITTFYPSHPPRDMRSQKAALRQVLDTWQGTTLPANLWAAEDLARTVAQLLANCIGARVARPSEGFEAWVWL